MAHLLRVLSLLRVHVVSLFTAQLGEGQQLVDMFLSSPIGRRPRDDRPRRCQPSAPT